MQQLIDAIVDQQRAHFLALLKPHRRVLYRFSCVCASRAETFAADCYLLTDLVVVCQTTGVGLKPWLLASLRQLLIGDEALDGDRGQVATRVVGRATTPWTLALLLDAEPFRLELPTQQDLAEFETQLSRAKSELDAIDTDGRRAERRLHLQLDETVAALVTSTTTMRRKLYRRRSQSTEGALGASVLTPLAPSPTPYLFRSARARSARVVAARPPSRHARRWR